MPRLTLEVKQEVMKTVCDGNGPCVYHDDPEVIESPEFQASKCPGLCDWPGCKEVGTVSFSDDGWFTDFIPPDPLNRAEGDTGANLCNAHVIAMVKAKEGSQS